MAPEPTAFKVEWVHEALACLYSTAELANSELAQALPDVRDTENPEQRAQLLRKVLLDLIRSLQPSGRRPPSASAARAYDCLTLRYVSGFTVEEVATELSLSPRQVYRDLHWGEEQLAALLPARVTTQPRPGDENADALRSEIGSLAHRPEPVDLAEAVSEGITALTVLAKRLSVALHYQGPEHGAVVSATPGILRELVVQLLSAVVQSAPGKSIEVTLSPRGNEVSLDIPTPAVAAMARRDLLEAALQIADVQGFRHELIPTADGNLVRIAFPAAPSLKLLVIEDNPGAYALYQRYLERTGWEPIHVAHPRLAADLAVAKKVQAIILDLMMPEVSGWDVLQGLKLNPRTRHIPVIVCSVLDDRELAAALGATAYLTKPLARLDLLQALREVLQGNKQASDW